MISSPTSAPAVLPSRSSAPSNAFAALATTEIASESRPKISSISGLTGGALFARVLGRACASRLVEWRPNFVWQQGEPGSEVLCGAPASEIGFALGNHTQREVRPDAMSLRQVSTDKLIKRRSHIKGQGVGLPRAMPGFWHLAAIRRSRAFTQDLRERVFARNAS